MRQTERNHHTLSRAISQRSSCLSSTKRFCSVTSYIIYRVTGFTPDRFTDAHTGAYIHWVELPSLNVARETSMTNEPSYENGWCIIEVIPLHQTECEPHSSPTAKCSYGGWNNQSAGLDRSDELTELVDQSGYKETKTNIHLAHGNDQPTIGLDSFRRPIDTESQDYIWKKN